MCFLLLLILLVPLQTEAARPPAEPDTLTLGTLRNAAARQDPRAVQPELLRRAAELRIAALAAQRRPRLSLTGQATLQNEVTDIPVDVPGQEIPTPPRDQYRAQIETDWLILDGGRTRLQTQAAQARLAESVAGVAAGLYALREATTAAYFGGLLAGAQADVLRLATRDLETRLEITATQVQEGTALSAQSAALEAELIRIAQSIREAEANRSAAFGVLEELTGMTLSPADTLALPHLDSEVAAAVAAVAAHGDAVARPELLQLRLAADRAEAEARAVEAQTRPTVSLFGQAGIGRPSPFNFLSKDVDDFGLAGVRLRWPVVDWGRTRREAEALRIEARVAATEAEAFARRVERGIEDELAQLERLRGDLTDDERAVALREQALGVAAAQLEEGVLLPDVYVDRLTDLAEARLVLVQHRIELAYAQTVLLSALGRYPGEPTDGLIPNN